MSPDAADAVASPRRPAPSPTVLDVFVVWHPGDTIGRDIRDALFDHYHSDVFSGLAGGAAEVYGRSVPAPGFCTPPPITTRIGSVGGGPVAAHSPAMFSVVLVVVGRKLVRASMEAGPWREYLEDLLRLRDDDAARGKVLVLPVLPRNRIESQGTPVARLMELQGVSGILGLQQDADGDPVSAHGALARDLG